MNLPINTIIETSRCKLRSTKKKDIPFIFSATRYKGFNDGMLWDAPKNEAELIATYEDGVTKAWYERQSYGFTICDKFNDEPFTLIKAYVVGKGEFPPPVGCCWVSEQLVFNIRDKLVITNSVEFANVHLNPPVSRPQLI